jgi:hypothetical protein
MKKCEICKRNTADYYMQFIGEDKPSFYRAGYHIRGFKIVKICDDCRFDIEKGLIIYTPDKIYYSPF